MKQDEMVIKLPKDDPTAIQALVFWMYHDKIYLSNGKIEGELYINDSEEEAMKGDFGLLSRLYILGDKYQMSRLRNDVIDAILLLKNVELPPMAVISHIFNNTTISDSLRRILVGIVHELLSIKSQIKNCKDVISHDFLFNLMVSTFDLPATTTPISRDFCSRFHIHAALQSPCRILKKYTVSPSPE
jgi:hypothetical protein